MRVCIYGAGAIGGWIGVKLGLAGHDVSVVARGATLEAIERDGLQLKERGTSHTLRVKVTDRPEAVGQPDVLVIAVKAQAMSQVARSIAPLITADTTVVTALNGIPWWFCGGLESNFRGIRLETVDPDGAIAAAIPSSQTLGCVVHASCSVEAPGVIRHNQGDSLVIGEANGGESSRVKHIADVFTQSRFNARASHFIQADVWYKLWGNMTMNPVSALTGATTDKILEDPLTRGFVTRVMLEAKQIGAHFGIPIEQDPEQRHEVTAKLGAIKTSMLQDMESGKSIELDALLGAVRELGGLTNVDTPFMDALLGLTRLRARQQGLYPAQGR